MNADGVRCRESAGAGPVVFEIVPVTGAAFSGITMEQFLCASLFSHPFIGTVWAYMRHVNVRYMNPRTTFFLLVVCFCFHKFRYTSRAQPRPGQSNKSLGQDLQILFKYKISPTSTFLFY